MFADVQERAANLDKNGQKMLGDLSALAAKADPAGVFDGPAANSYKNAFERWRKAQEEASAALTQLSRALKVVTENFEQVNRNGASAFDSFYGG